MTNISPVSHILLLFSSFPFFFFFALLNACETNCKTWETRKIYVIRELTEKEPVEDRQARNQESFRAGEFSRNQGTSINISSTTHERKAPQGKNMGFFLLETLKTTFKMRNLIQYGHNQSIFCPKLGHFFSKFWERAGETTPPTPSRAWPCKSYHQVSINFFWNNNSFLFRKFLLC